MNGTLVRDTEATNNDGLGGSSGSYWNFYLNVASAQSGPAQKNGYVTGIELDLLDATVAADGTCVVMVEDGQTDPADNVDSPETIPPSKCAYYNDEVAVASTDAGSVISVASLAIEQANFRPKYPVRVWVWLKSGSTLEINTFRVRVVYALEGN